MVKPQPQLRPRYSEEHLLAGPSTNHRGSGGWVRMEPLPLPKGGEKGSSRAVQNVAVETQESSSYRDEPPLDVRPNIHTRTTSTATQQYRVYKRRWVGLIQLVLLNIIISWDVSKSEQS